MTRAGTFQVGSAIPRSRRDGTTAVLAEAARQEAAVVQWIAPVFHAVVARAIWPVKTAEHWAAAASVQPRMAKYWLAGYAVSPAGKLAIIRLLELANARTSAEVLDARDLATAAYDAAKRAARIGKAKQAHDSLIAAAHRTQADALEIEAAAKRRLADEYDAAQERGEVASGRPKTIPDGNSFCKSETVSHLGLTSKAIHEARQLRDAEKAEPGIVRRTLDEALDTAEEPTRAKVRRAVKAKVVRKPAGHRNRVEETQHDRDLRMLLGVWEAACESARQEFLQTVETRG